MKTGYAIYDVTMGVWWTGDSWSTDKEKAEIFSFELFAQHGAALLNGGVGMRVEKVTQYKQGE